MQVQEVNSKSANIASTSKSFASCGSLSLPQSVNFFPSINFTHKRMKFEVAISHVERVQYFATEIQQKSRQNI